MEGTVTIPLSRYKELESYEKILHENAKHFYGLTPSRNFYIDGITSNKPIKEDDVISYVIKINKKLSVELQKIKDLLEIKNSKKGWFKW